MSDEKLTHSQHKALHDKLGADLADFFGRHHGVETDDEEEDTTTVTGDTK